MKQDIRKVKSIEDWIRYFSENLGWYIDFDEVDDIDDITYQYTAEDLGLKPESFAKVKSLRQMAPLTNDQPWGVFCVEFEGKRFEITALRRILSTLIPRKRNQKTEFKTWNLNDLLFICSWGDGNETTLGLAHFEEREGVLPQLKVIYCAPAKEDTHNIHTFEERIGHLQWPSDPSDTESWRGSWSAAFTSGYRETIHFAAELTQRLAKEALAIRDRILHTLEIETEQGYVHGLYNKFKEQLLHDMQEKDFADMYAQTIVYGLFSARCMDDAPETFSAAEAVVHIPNTNPFLKDLLKECLDVKTRSGISFDELEVGNVVDILAGIDPKEIVQDFGRQTGGGREDPVLHFYEEFLNAYDKTQKVQRGVYYTPQPVVNFIVRAVDDILKNEFGLKDGLASTETKLVEMPVEKTQAGKSGLKTVMEKVEVPAVQVLDPATGTGTFLRQVILTIYENFKAAHKGESDAAVRKAWNEYVPEHLLPRINGFELMMAPYAVAHMKLAMVLQETGYEFQSDKRLQVYLTNTLEEPNNSGSQMSLFSDPLAMESVAANQAKCNTGINVILGNPPYSGESSNKSEWIMTLMEEYKKEPGGEIKLQEKNPKWLNDDYVKFIRFGQHNINVSKIGILAYICPHGFLDNPTFRGMRWSLLQQFSKLYILNLHGNTKRKETAPDGGKDENVFDIMQGVCIVIGIKNESTSDFAEVNYSDFFGLRLEKNKFLDTFSISNINFTRVNLHHPNYYYANIDYSLKDEYDKGFCISQLFSQYSVGLVTARDTLTLQDSFEKIKKIATDFMHLQEEDARVKYNLGKDVRDWKVEWAQQDLKESCIDGKLDPLRFTRISYRCFDNKYSYFTGKSRGFYCYPRYEIMKYLLNNENLAFVTVNRQPQQNPVGYYFVADHPVSNGYIRSDSVSIDTVFPLYIYEDNFGKLEKKHNFNPDIISRIEDKLGLKLYSKSDDQNISFTPEDLLGYIYAVLYSQKYRNLFSEYLKIEFPTVPYPTNVEIFWRLVKIGRELINIHLERNIPKNHVSYYGKNDFKLEKPKYENGKIIMCKQGYFYEFVEEAVWNFYIGGYQPLQKWAKDHKGEIMTEEKISHYRNMIAAIQRTIEIMEEIDRIIVL